MKSFVFILFIILSIPLYADASEGTEEFYKRVVKIARESVGLKYVPSVNGKHFTSDCIGFVRYVYYRAGFDLEKTYGRGRGGVSSLYNGLIRYGFTYDSKLANPGDLVFFDNTYDINRNGKWDDALTHVGIVVGTGRHNTIYYIHFSNSGVDEDRINLFYPNTHAFRQVNGKLYIINSYLRRNRGEGYSKKEYISSSFYRCFAKIRLKVKN